MIHRFTVVEELDCPVKVAVAAYLDCEHYLYLHKSLTDRLEVVKVDGRKVTVKQGWKWLGVPIDHYKTGEFVPPAEFLLYDVKPALSWLPSPVALKTRVRYDPVPERDACTMTFEVELDLAWFLWPLRFRFQTAIEAMHAQQNAEDMAMIKRREKLFGRGNIAHYLADGHFCYHKDEFVKLYG